MRRLDDNSLDMGFTYNPGAVTGIPTEPLMGEDLYLVGAVGDQYPGETVSFATVCQRSLILPSRGFGLRDWVEDTARKKDATITVSFEIDSVATMRDLVLGGLGWTILPYAVVQQAVQANQLFASQIVRPKVTRTLHFLRGLACGKQRNPAVRGIIDQVIADSIASSNGRLRRS